MHRSYMQYGAAELLPVCPTSGKCLQDMKRVLGDGYFIRAKIASKMLAKADLQCAFDFVELQMLLPRRQCIETQVALLHPTCLRAFPDCWPDRSSQVTGITCL